MAGSGKLNKNRLRVCRVVDVPLREVSGICLRRGLNGKLFLIAVGDRTAKIAWFSQPRSDVGRINWHTRNIAKLSGSILPKRDSQIEAVCADGLGRVLLLQETPPRVELIDPETLKVVASIDLGVEGRGEIARAWSEPKGSRGEGMVLLPGGHLLVAKEKKPAAFIEFGPPHSRSRGLVRGGGLADGKRWPIKKGDHRFVALASWLPDKTLAKTCADFSDLEVGPDGYLYLLSDKSCTIARLGDLPAGGGTAVLLDAWQLGDLDGTGRSPFQAGCLRTRFLAMAFFAPGSPSRKGWAEQSSLCPGSSHINLFGYCQRIVNLNAKIPDGALNFAMAE
jgi:hypothetical protein